MTAGHLARIEATTLDPAKGLLARIELGVPTPWMGHLSRVEITAPVALVANAGADAEQLEPYFSHPLTGTHTGGTATSRIWRQVSGPPVTITNPSQATATFKAPGTIAGVDCVFGYTATGSNGAPSVESTTKMNILPVTERAVIGGVEVPMELRQAGSN